VAKRPLFSKTRQYASSLSFLDRFLTGTSRLQPTLLLALVCCAVAAVGALVIGDLRSVNAEAQNMFASSIQGLQRIGELQYDTQETRRATLYALTTNDSNLQVVYADQSRSADQRVKDGIAEYGRHARRPAETVLAKRLNRDWDVYLAIRDEVLASILEGSTREAVNLDISGGVQAFDLVRQDLQEIKRVYDEDASQRIAKLVATSRQSSIKLIGILSFTFLLSLVAVWAIQRGQMLGTIRLASLQMEFVASVSHELRTPLAVLSSAADNIADGLVEGDAALRKYGALLQNQSRRMSSMVDEILLFASTEDRQNRYVLERLQISQIVKSVTVSTESLIHQSGVTFEQHVQPDLPEVLGDLVRITQCLDNLIGNAVKYGGEQKWISLNINVALREHGLEKEVRISVVDRGIGIERSELIHIFDPFYRSPRVNAAQIHGTGLGLSLAKKIAEAMGGRISVHSEPSLGSTFTLHLPVALLDEGQSAASVSS
jgi:signal transduction histidine kinase